MEKLEKLKKDNRKTVITLVLALSSIIAVAFSLQAAVSTIELINFCCYLLMAASSDSDKKFMALVTESDSGTTIKKIQNEPGTVQETKIKLKAQKLEVKATKQRLKDMKNAEIESSTRGFKRPLWAQANRMPVVTKCTGPRMCTRQPRRTQHTEHP